MMTCESVREELVAYRDGELPEHDRERIAEHLKTCLVCHREEAQLARTEQLLVTMARIPPSQDFAVTFWKRLEQEKLQPRTAPLETISRPELSFVRWWREVREIFNASQEPLDILRIFLSLFEDTTSNGNPGSGARPCSPRIG
jgi:anti-sigma factor RsiW